MAATAIGCGVMKNDQIKEKHADQVTHNLLTQERQKAILESLKAKSIYDETTQVSYIFEAMPEDMDILWVAARNNIFFATLWVINVYIPDAHAVQTLKNNGYTYTEVAKDVYQVRVQWDMQTAQKNLQNQTWVKAAVYEYNAYTAGCITYNDPEFTGYGQAHISADPWIAAWYPNTPTHAIDSVDIWKPMHVQSTAANPKAVATVIDSGINTSNADFNGNVLYSYDYSNNVSWNTITNSNHGSKVMWLMAAKANNNSGWVWVAGWFPIITYDAGTDSWLINNALYSSLDDLYVQATNNADKKYVLNQSFVTWNDPIYYAKLLQLYNLQDHKQVFFVAGSWNSWSNTVSYPAARPEVIWVGAVNAEDPNKALWSSSNTWSALDFVADGQNARVMSANGTFSTWSWTSFASPIVAWAVLHLISQDPNADFAKVYNRLKQSAKDYWATGFDDMNGWGFARTASALKYAVVEDVPTSIDAGGNNSYTYNFTPKFYNTPTSSTVQTLNRKCYYPNNTLVPSTVNPDGTVTFNVVVNANNWFSATNPAVNRLRYEFTPSNAPSCVTTIKTKPITITNLGTLGTQEVDVLQGNYYPNPVQDKLTISNVSKLWLRNAKANVVDLSGRTVLTTTLSTLDWDKATIDMSHLASGMYLIQVQPKDAIRPKPIKIIKK